ncbi:MAG: hypothetical protein JO041_04655 [Acidobacteria bacterium]|nr:hypothetical protein [Acidobacteriota bacterium]
MTAPRSYGLKSAPLSVGRMFFGAAAVLLGAIALIWHDSATWQILQQIWKLPAGSTIGAFLMAALVAGGIAIQHPRSARPAAVVLCIVFACFSLACVPDFVAASNPFERFGGSFFQMLSMLCGALALYAAMEGNSARARIFGRTARLGLGLCAISFALSQALFLRPTAALVPKWIPPGQMFWAIVTTIAFALSAVALLIHFQARLAARMMALMLALFGVLVWFPHLVADRRAHFVWSEFALTMLIAGAAWMVADLQSR